MDEDAVAVDWIDPDTAEVTQNADAWLICLMKHCTEDPTYLSSELPLAAAVAYATSKPLLYVRKRPKAHGLGRVVEGAPGRGWRAVIVDDVATTGSSLLRAAEALAGEGVEAVAAVVVVDRGEGASEVLRGRGITLLSLTTSREVLEAGAGSHGP